MKKQLLIMVLLSCLPPGLSLAQSASQPASQPASAPAAPCGMLLKGNQQALWLVRPGTDDDTSVYSLYVQKQGHWANIAQNQQNTPLSALAAGDRLHLFFPENGYLTVDMEGKSQVAPNLPGPLLHACEAIGFKNDANPVVLAVIAPKTPEDRPMLYRAFGNEWVKLFPAADGPMAFTGSHLVQYASAGKLHISTGDGQWTTVNCPGEVREQNVISLLAIKGQVLLVLAKNGERDEVQLSLLPFDPKDQKFHKLRPVLRDGTPFAAASPRVTAQDDQIVFLSGRDKALSLVRLDTTGKIHSVESLNDVLKDLPDPRWAEQVRQYFLLGVGVLMLIVMFAFKPRTASSGPQPFVLPDYLKPAHLLKRGVALLIDFLPFSFMLSLYLMFKMGLSPEKMFELSRQEAPEFMVQMAVPSMVLLSVFAVYGAIMEMIWGKTFGKWIMKICVIANNGTRPAPREILLRNLMKIVELWLLLFSTLGFALLLFPVFTRYRQRMGDIFARTTVIDSYVAGPHPQPSKEAETPEDENAEPPSAAE